MGIFEWIYIEKASFFRYTSDILKDLCFYLAIEIFNLKDPMHFMKKTYLLPKQIGVPLANASTICRIYCMDRVLQEMYCHRILVSWISIAEKIR